MLPTGERPGQSAPMAPRIAQDQGPGIDGPWGLTCAAAKALLIDYFGLYYPLVFNIHTVYIYIYNILVILTIGRITKPKLV